MATLQTTDRSRMSDDLRELAKSAKAQPKFTPYGLAVTENSGFFDLAALTATNAAWHPGQSPSADSPAPESIVPVALPSITAAAPAVDVRAFSRKSPWSSMALSVGGVTLVGLLAVGVAKNSPKSSDAPLSQAQSAQAAFPVAAAAVVEPLPEIVAHEPIVVSAPPVAGTSLMPKSRAHPALSGSAIHSQSAAAHSQPAVAAHASSSARSPSVAPAHVAPSSGDSLMDAIRQSVANKKTSH